MISDLLLVVFLIVLNGFFVAAEFAIVKVRYSQVEADVTSDVFLARITQHILDHIDSYLSASQIGITLASLGLGWIGEPVVAAMMTEAFSVFDFSVTPETLHRIALPVGFIFITILHLIFGEVIPKYVAITHPQGTSYLAAVPLRMAGFVFRPLIIIINGVARSILAPFGIRVGEEDDSHTEDELRLLLAESAKSAERGTIKSTEHELIEKVFSFDERLVRQIMVPRTQMVSVALNATTDEIFDLIAREGYTRMPVFSGSRENIVGVVHTKDLLKLLRLQQTIHVNELIRPPYFIPETKKCSELLREFQNRRIHLAIVVDEFGVTSGLVTLEDIVEELVGEIQDEYDEEIPVVEKKGETAFVANAHAPIVDLNKSLPVPLPENPQYSTLAGLINIIFSIIPDVGQSRVFGRYEFTILKRSKRSVDSILLELLPEKTEDLDSEDSIAEGDRD